MAAFEVGEQAVRLATTFCRLAEMEATRLLATERIHPRPHSGGLAVIHSWLRVSIGGVRTIATKCL